MHPNSQKQTIKKIEQICQLENFISHSLKIGGVYGRLNIDIQINRARVLACGVAQLVKKGEESTMEM